MAERPAEGSPWRIMQAGGVTGPWWGVSRGAERGRALQKCQDLSLDPFFARGGRSQPSISGITPFLNICLFHPFNFDHTR